MAWTSLNTRIANLPLILAGPILRRVEKDSVSVWVALHQPMTSTLKVVLTVYNSSNNILIQGEYLNPIILGDNFRACVVTAKATNPADYLLGGEVYRYNIELYEGATSIGNLLSPGVLTNGSYVVDLSYDGSGLPSFSLPPSNVNLLNLVHGSCRKPHGGEADGRYDALVALDLMHLKAYSESLNSTDPNTSFAYTRPHLLFLTGDQIYADDVSDVLLYMLRDANSVLMGWEEDLPSLTGVISNSDTRLQPGKR